ncbi:toprim domain-containing protein [Hyphomicrobium sp. CS1BSMeth3]|uniref:DUF7146 domain-containing protein n=1 Tax=Hyphomicrobium sp. CS1BSMeth3 TaxID=1892844 RepID=UPI0009309485|nr:toprim domain-containing protein [Hyphomicrobium sp. CS1BSMeth3]
MRSSATELAHHLAREAEAVCRKYLSNGRRVGRYWIVGDVRNAPGRSMYVRLFGPEGGQRAAGKWTDGATGEHGDLLDVIRESLGLIDFRDVTDEARRFLSLPRSEPDLQFTFYTTPAPTGSPEAARRLIAASQPIRGTLVETYLRHRCIDDLHDVRALCFHPCCYYRPEDDGPTQIWPAMIARVTDLRGQITGAHRTWLDRNGVGKAPVETQRKAMGSLLGHAVRFGPSAEVMVAGEGIETMLSLRMALTGMPMMAALSAGHLSAILFPDPLRRLYIARDIDLAGNGAMATLTARATAVGIETIPLSPRLGDFNEDLVAFGLDDLRARVCVQVTPQDIGRFLRAGPPGRL